MAEEFSKEELESLLTEADELDLAAKISAQKLPTVSEWLEGRQAELASRLEAYFRDAQEIVEELRLHESARAVAALGVMAVLTGELNEQDRQLLESARQMFHRSAAFATRIGSLASDQIIERSATVETRELPAEGSEAVETPEIAEEEPAEIRVHISQPGELIVNEKPLALLPAHRFLFEFFIFQDAEFREQHLYSSPEFEKVIRAEGQKSPIATAYSNALKGLSRRLEVIGISDFVTHVGGGRIKARVIKRGKSVSIDDERKGLERTEEIKGSLQDLAVDLAEAIVDRVDIGKEVDSAELAKRHFKVGELNIVEELLLQIALNRLDEEFSSEELTIVRLDNGRIRLVEPELEAESLAVEREEGRGDFKALENKVVVYENVRIPLNENEQIMIVAIRQTDSPEGATKQFVRDILKARGKPTKKFDEEFAELRRKLGPALERRLPTKRRMGIVTRYKVKDKLQ